MGKKILVAEDNPDMRKVLSMRLEISNYSVIMAEEGESALEKAKKESPDLIILDLMIPNISGFEVCRMLKFDDKYKHIPIFVLSALDQKNDREKALENGADGYFVKPFDLEILVNKIKAAIGE